MMLSKIYHFLEFYQYLYIFGIFQSSSADPFFFVVGEILIKHPSSIWMRDDRAEILSIKIFFDVSEDS